MGGLAQKGAQASGALAVAAAAAALRHSQRIAPSTLRMCCADVGSFGGQRNMREYAAPLPPAALPHLGRAPRRHGAWGRPG